MEENKELKIAQKPNASWAFEPDRTNAWAFWNQAFTPKECQQIIDYAEKFEKQESFKFINRR
jgi:GH25 family lysozyme M1 (1,4-beta-N-acetylmuramidase)